MRRSRLSSSPSQRHLRLSPAISGVSDVTRTLSDVLIPPMGRALIPGMNLKGREPMQRPPLIVDAVCHIFDFSRISPDSPGKRDEYFRRLTQLTGGVVDFTKYSYVPDDQLTAEIKGNLDAVYQTMFVNSPIDVAMVGNGSANAGNAPEILALCHRFAQEYPERAILGGGVDPVTHGLSAALDSIEYQARELGARSMKFYPFAWACDDREIAYPLYEKCLSEGIKIVQYHKLMPAFHVNVEMFRPNDLQAPARDFPELSFCMHHIGDLYFHETVDIVHRFENIYLVLTPTIHMILAKPRWAQEKLGHLLQQVGAEKLIYGSEGPMMGDPTRYIEAFLNLEIPEDLRDGYGYPSFTASDYELIMGGNMARLLDIDITKKRLEIAGLPSGR